AGIKYIGVNPTNFRDDGRSLVAASEACPERDQEDLLAFRAEINWDGDEAVLCLVKSRDRFHDLRVVGFNSYCHRCRDALPTGIGGEQAGRNRGDLRRAGRYSAVAAGDGNACGAGRGPWRNEPVDL